MHWEQGGHGALGEPTHNLSVDICAYVRDILTAEGGGEEPLPPCLFWSSLFFKTLSWSQLRAPS